MSFQIFKYSKVESCLIPLEDLDFYKEFPQLKEFSDFLPNLSFLSYYIDFKLLLCATCSSAINPSNYKGHLEKHLKNIKEKKQFLSKGLAVLQSLEVSSPSSSLELIQKASFRVVPFKELTILSNLF